MKMWCFIIDCHVKNSIDFYLLASDISAKNGANTNGITPKMVVIAARDTGLSLLTLASISPCTVDEILSLVSSS